MDPVVGIILGAAITGLCGIIIELIRRPDRKKVEETHRQLTTNHHVSSPPTVLDKLDTLVHQVNRLETKFDKHIDWHMEQK
jgi:hypothetical protein